MLRFALLAALAALCFVPTAALADDCPADPNKTDPGQCGCGVADVDGDGDGVADCVDGCPADGQKSDFGVCGCGVADDDLDDDGFADCVDGCPDDPNKGDFGVCGCGVADTDGDGDGVADCVDGCPEDPSKGDFGVCGCGVVDADGDGDGLPDCVDGCPDDPNKGDFGVCGCGVVDLDGDGDGFADCVDACPDDASKVDGPCDDGPVGCEADGDGDGVCDADDAEMACATVANVHLVTGRRGLSLGEVRGRFELNGWTAVDLARDGATVSLDGLSFRAEGRTFRGGDVLVARGGRWRSSWRLTVNLRTRSWSLRAAGIAGDGLDLSDGLTVGLTLGAQSSVEHVALRSRGRWRGTRYTARRSAAELCACADGVSRRRCPDAERPRACRRR